MNKDELLAEVLVRPRSSFVPYPGIECIDTPTWHQLTAPAFKEGVLNGVSLAVLSLDTVDDVIDRTMEEYASRQQSFRWSVGPDSRPLDLGERLIERGFKAVSTAGMAAQNISEALDSDIQVELVGPENVAEYSDVMMRGWEMDSQPLRDYNEHCARIAPENPASFMARINGKGVGVANYFAFAKSAHFMGGVVLPECRGRGVYRALVQARQAHARYAGLDLVTTHAMVETSAPLLENMGFEHVCAFTTYAAEYS